MRSAIWTPWFGVLLAACAPTSNPSFFGPGATPPPGVSASGAASAPGETTSPPTDDGDERQADWAPAPTADALTPLADAATPLAAVVATGPEIAVAIAGWRARAPAGWQVRTQREIDSPSQESLVLLTFRRGVNIESAVAARRDELTNASTWSAIGAVKIGDREAAIAEASGASDERGPLRWRVVWIQADDGVLEVLGVGLSAEGDATRAQVDGVARTVRFVAPVRGKVELANPCYQFYHSSFGVTVSRTLGLDGQGHAQWGGYVGQLTTYISPTGAPLGSTSGLWRADPDRGVYGIEGDQLIVHWDDGRISTWAIRWNAGRVGMLVQDGDPYVACS